jgi:hypothetical protein
VPTTGVFIYQNGIYYVYKAGSDPSAAVRGSGGWPGSTRAWTSKGLESRACDASARGCLRFPPELTGGWHPDESSGQVLCERRSGGCVLPAGDESQLTASVVPYALRFASCGCRHRREQWNDFEQVARVPRVAVGPRLKAPRPERDRPSRETVPDSGGPLIWVSGEPEREETARAQQRGPRVTRA